jgi:hypothetical protein
MSEDRGSFRQRLMAKSDTAIGAADLDASEFLLGVSSLGCRQGYDRDDAEQNQAPDCHASDYHAQGRFLNLMVSRINPGPTRP